MTVHNIAWVSHCGIYILRLFFNETMEGQDCGDEIGKWISDYLGEQGFRLLRYVEGMKQRNIHGFTWKVWDVATVDGDTVNIFFSYNVSYAVEYIAGLTRISFQMKFMKRA